MTKVLADEECSERALGSVLNNSGKHMLLEGQVTGGDTWGTLCNENLFGRLLVYEASFYKEVVSEVAREGIAIFSC